MDVSGATQPPERRVPKPHSPESRDPIENAILSAESNEIRRRYEESQRRRNAAGVPLDPGPGRVDELLPGEVAGEPAPLEQPRTETVMDEHASGCTDLPMWIEGDKETTEATESDRQPKRSKTDASELVNELIHLEAAIGPRLRDGCQFGELSWKSHGGGTTDLGKHDECDPKHPDESKVKILEK